MRLTQKQKKAIITEYISGGVSQRELAKKYNCTQKTISCILSNPEIRQKVSQVKEEVALSMAAFLDSKKEIAQELIAEAMACMKEKIRKATLKDTVAMVEKLSVVFKDKDGVELQDDEGKVTIIFKDCGGGNSE